MKKFLMILLPLLLILSLVLALRAWGKPEEVHIDFPFSTSDVENIQLYHYDCGPTQAEKKLVTKPSDIQSLYETLSGITYFVKELEPTAGGAVTSFRFNLADGSSYALIYAGYGVKNGEIFSPTAGFRYFTTADIGAKWYNIPVTPVPAEEWELPLMDGSDPTQEPVPVPTAVEVTDPFDAILFQEGTFRDSVYGEVTLEEYCETFYQETRVLAVPTKAARVDMDGDGTQELAIVLTETEDMLILHIQDGQVEGQEFPSVMLDQLKADGSFRWRGQRGTYGFSVMEFSQPIWATRCVAMEDCGNYVNEQLDDPTYYADPEIFPDYQDMDPEEAFRKISAAQDAKPDAPWFDLHFDPPAATEAYVLSESQQALVDVVTRDGEFYDLGEGKLTTPQQFLNEFSERTSMSVLFPQMTALDFDGDGEQELALWIRVGEFNDYGLLVLHYENGQVEGQGYAYRQMNDLKTDGTFFWSGSASYNGVSRLRFGSGAWEKEVLHQVDYDLDTAPFQYMVDGAEATREEFDQAIEMQLAKEDAHWVDFPCEDFAQLWG